MSTNEEMKAKVQAKLYAEHEEYKEWLFALEPGEILRNSYEYCIREGIVRSVETLNLSNEQCEVLLNIKNVTQLAYMFFDAFAIFGTPIFGLCLTFMANLCIYKDKGWVEE